MYKFALRCELMIFPMLCPLSNYIEYLMSTVLFIVSSIVK